MELFTGRRRLLTNSHSLASDLAQIRIQSHRSPGLSQQIWLAFRCGLTYRLYSLASQIRAVKMKVEVRWVTLRCYPLITASQMAMDEQLVTPQNVVNEPLPHPGGTQLTSQYVDPHFYNFLQILSCL